MSSGTAKLPDMLQEGVVINPNARPASEKRN